MNKATVKELMVPLGEYPTVSEDATVYEAVSALEKAQEEFDKTRYRHRAILVHDGKKRIVGILRLTDMFKLLCEKIKSSKTSGDKDGIR